MGFKNNFLELINIKLLEKGISLNMQEHKLKKDAVLFNEILKEIYELNKEKEVKMYTLLLSLSEYFDLTWFKENILNKENLDLITKEMQEEFHINNKKKKK